MEKVVGFVASFRITVYKLILYTVLSEERGQSIGATVRP
jgi:hypothetical protein